jgi:uncharacterized integral membrane protein (TIGR00697 family)
LTKRNKLFLLLGGFFITNAILAELIGGKVFSLEKTLGISPFDITIFGNSYSMNLTAGVLLWPVVFIFTDIINEYFGKKGVKRLSYMAVALIIYAFFMIWIAMGLSPSDYYMAIGKEKGISDMNNAFNAVFGQGLWIIVGSIVAFLVGQLVDVLVFQKIKEKTKDKMLWLRATGSTVVSQFIDSLVVTIIAFYISGLLSLKVAIALALVGYIYKLIVAIVLTPMLYLLHGMIDRYLGEEK